MLLTKRNVDQSLVTPYDMRLNKRTLESTIGHLSDNVRSGYIKPFEDQCTEIVTSKFFSTKNKGRNRASEAALAIIASSGEDTAPPSTAGYPPQISSDSARMSFYLTLLSDSSLNMYPDKTILSFQVQLPKLVEL